MCEVNKGGPGDFDGPFQAWESVKMQKEKVGGYLSGTNIMSKDSED